MGHHDRDCPNDEVDEHERKQEQNCTEGHYRDASVAVVVWISHHLLIVFRFLTPLKSEL